MSTPGDPHDPSLHADFGTKGPDPDFKPAFVSTDWREAGKTNEKKPADHETR